MERASDRPIHRAATHERWADLELPPAVALVGSFVLVALISFGDLLTGPYLVFATFYLLPVAICAWFVGRWAGVLMAFLSAAFGVAMNAVDPGPITPLVSAWNGSLRFVTYVVVALIVSFERDAMRTIRELASTDPLTGAANRRRFLEVGTTELSRAVRGDHPLSLAYLDVDGLKSRNDRLGHAAGDVMLQGLVDAAAGVIRASDLLARMGGDEFCILLPGTGPAEAAGVVKRITGRLDVLDPPITVSVGIVGGVPRPTASLEELIADADARMMEAKDAGKGRVVVGAFRDDADEVGGATSSAGLD